MKSKLFQFLQYFILLAFGLGMCWAFFRDFDLNDLVQKTQTGNFFWFYMVMCVSLIVYIFRVLRWQMLIKATGHNASFGNVFSALSIGYFVNFFFPRFGEVTRCLTIKKQHSIPFMQLLGTVIIERVVDIISLLVVLAITLILQFNQVIEFFEGFIFKPVYNEIILKIIGGNEKTLLLAITTLLLLIFLFFIFRKYILVKSPLFIFQFIQGLKEGLSSIAKLQQKKLFLFYTFSIWVCYYLMTYFWIFIFNETSSLGLGACLSILCIGTIGRSIPIQGGGMGAYHFLVTNVIILYGVGESWGKTLSTLIHAGQTFFTFVMGLVGLIIFFIQYWRKR